MADEPTELRRINWSECFPFTQIFRTFRIAIHPGKLGLALAAILLTMFCGWLLDSIWPSSHQPMAGEIDAFWQTPSIDEWQKDKFKHQVAVVEQAYRLSGETVPHKLSDYLQDSPSKEIRDAQEKVRKAWEDRLDKAKEAWKSERPSEEEMAAQIADLTRPYNELYADLKAVEPPGIFTGYLEYQMQVLAQMMDAARRLDFIAGFDTVLSARRHPVGADSAAGAVSCNLSVLSCLVLMVRGEQWLVTEHFVYYMLFGLICLAIWSLLGGAICRMAALNVTRDEHMSPKVALDFAKRKFVAFLSAPLLPLVLIVIVGVFLFVGGLVMTIPAVGELLGGAGMFLALAGGFIMALVAIGAAAGWSLFWPTIAVEGSDGFDAISRSYSYIYSKPWRAGFYAVVALVYGALTYLFVRCFVYLMLKLTHMFVGAGTWFTDRPKTGVAGATKLDAMWPAPSFDTLWVDPAPLGLQGAEAAGSTLIHLWVFLVTALLCAYLVSFFFSASTIIYCLLRRAVDAIDIEEVYLDEDTQEETASEPSPESPAPAAGSAAPPAESRSQPPAERNEKLSGELDPGDQDADDPQ